MTFTSITGLLNTLSSLSLAAFVFLRRPQHRTNQAYLFFGFTVALYSAGYFLWGLAQSEADALFAFKILTSGIILINSTYLEFVFSLLEERRGKKIILWTCHLINLFFIYAVFSLLLFKTVAKKNIWGYWPVVENLFYVYFVLWLGQFLYGLFHLYRGYKSTTGQRSTQIEYVFASTLIGYFGGATNWLPWFNFTFFPPHLNFLVTVYVAILAYAVVRHSLLDIEVIIRKTLVFAGLFGMVMLIVTSVTALLQNYLEQFLSMIPTLSVGLSGLIIILLYEPSKSWLVGITDRFLFQKGYSYDEIEDEIASCSEITDLNELCRRITEIFLKKMSLVRASLFLFEKDEGIFKAAASMGTSSLPEKVPAAKSPFDLIFKMQGKVF